MALTPVQQTLELIKQNKTILIVFKKDWTGDDLAAALALAKILEKFDKQVDVICEDFKMENNFPFLPVQMVKDKLAKLQKFIIKINTQKTPLSEFYYETEKNSLNIYLTPQAGQLQKEDIETSTSDYKYGLVFVVNSPDLESLGRVYEENADFFYGVPKINLDHSGRNEHFGNINLVDLAACSTSEIVYDLVREFDERLIDEEVATCLLAGMIMATKNFKTPHLSPKTLNLAGLLVAKGAKREEIISFLYQNRYVSTLRLWGRILSRLNNDLGDRLVWSSISANDFVETATTPSEMMDVIDELIVSMPKIEIVVLFYETSDGIKGVVYSAKNLDAGFIAKKFNPEGNSQIAKFSLPNTFLAEAERLVIDEIRERMK